MYHSRERGRKSREKLNDRGGALTTKRMISHLASDKGGDVVKCRHGNSLKPGQEARVFGSVALVGIVLRDVTCSCWCTFSIQGVEICMECLTALEGTVCPECGYKAKE